MPGDDEHLQIGHVAPRPPGIRPERIVARDAVIRERRRRVRRADADEMVLARGFAEQVTDDLPGLRVGDVRPEVRRDGLVVVMQLQPERLERVDLAGRHRVDGRRGARVNLRRPLESRHGQPRRREPAPAVQLDGADVGRHDADHTVGRASRVEASLDGVEQRRPDALAAGVRPHHERHQLVQVHCRHERGRPVRRLACRPARSRDRRRPRVRPARSLRLPAFPRTARAARARTRRRRRTARAPAPPSGGARAAAARAARAGRGPRGRSRRSSPGVRCGDRHRPNMPGCPIIVNRSCQQDLGRSRRKMLICPSMDPTPSRRLVEKGSGVGCRTPRSPRPPPRCRSRRSPGVASPSRPAGLRPRSRC